MSDTMKAAADRVLHNAVNGKPGVPGVVAVATDRQRDTYAGAAGKRVLGGADMTTDSVFAIFSTTKAITGTAALQLVEAGKLDLDTPAKNFVPEIGKLQVLDGFGADGKPSLRAPKRDITTRMLLLHTAGFGYDFFSHDYLRLATEHGQPSVITASHASLRTPLLFDPGERWEYGSNIDWAGLVVESIAGKRLGEVMQERIFAPLGMHDTAFKITPSMRERLVAMHQRDGAGALSPMDGFELPQDPEIQMGGHGLYSTALDYTKFIRMWLNDGRGPDGQAVLKAETVRMAEQNGLGELKIKGLPGVISSLSNDAEFFPGMPKSWALSFCSTGSTARTASAVSGRRRSCPSSTRRRWAAISTLRAPSMARRCARPPEACPSPARVAPEMGAGDVGLVQHCCRFVELLEDYVSTSPDP